MNLKQIEALKLVRGAWKDQDHPELEHGIAQWVRKLRQESKRRLKRKTARQRFSVQFLHQAS